MEKSIKSIWKDGFDNRTEWKNPKFKSFEKQKSFLVIDQIIKATETDNRNLIPVGILIVICISIWSYLSMAAYVLVLLTGMFFLNRNQINKFKKVTLDTNCYTYLISFRDTINETKVFYTKLLGIGLPLVSMPVLWIYLSSLENDVSLMLSFILTISVGLSFSLIGILSYRISIWINFRKLLKKLDKEISDLEVI